MPVTMEFLAERLAHIENEVSAMRRELEALLSAESQKRAWARLAESTFAEDWDNDLDAAYDHWRERHGKKGR